MACSGLFVFFSESGGTETVATESGVGESPSVAQLQNKVNRDQQYLATRAQHPAPSQQYKHASNGMFLNWFLVETKIALVEFRPSDLGDSFYNLLSLRFQVFFYLFSFY